MPKLTTDQSVTATTREEIKLEPKLRRKLLLELKTYQSLKDQVKVLEAALDKHKGIIGSLREETGQMSIALDGFKITLVSPIRKKFNPKKFVGLGGDLAIFNEAHEDVPGKSYEKVTLPNEDKEDE